VKIFGLQITRAPKVTNLNTVDTNRGWFPLIRESFGGAWQSNVSVDAPASIMAFSAIYSSVTVISNDIAKLRIKLVDEDVDGIRTNVTRSPYLAMLKKPNHFQTRMQLVERHISSKLMYGNAYLLKRRNPAGIVVSLYGLDPSIVQPQVAPDGDVYYKVGRDDIAGVREPIYIPASEIIHDRMNCLWHPLVGIGPIYAAAVSATMGNKIQSNSTNFFNNMSRPSGMLTAPGAISMETAERLKKDWEERFSAGKIGSLAVLGDGLEYQPMTITAEQAQLVDQLRWTVEDIARCFHIPIYKIGGPIPGAANVEALNQTYYSDCLQSLIESFEAVMDDGLSLKPARHTEIDLDGLLRMDAPSMVKTEAEGVKAGIKSPNESRRRLNLPPVQGGDTPYLQQQNFSLAALDERDRSGDPFGKGGSDDPEPSGGNVEINAEGVEMKVPGLRHLATTVKRLEQTLNNPVVPTYGPDGKLTGARRVRGSVPDGEDFEMMADLFVEALDVA